MNKHVLYYRGSKLDNVSNYKISQPTIILVLMGISRTLNRK